MDRQEIVKKDFPVVPDGYDRRSVEAHLEAVAATVAALEARLAALAVEREARTGAVRPAAASDPPARDAEPSEESSPEDAEVAARLVALKLVLDGTPRDEVITRVAREFDLEDPGAVVDEVISRAG
jgi:hypothetical protein